MNPNMPVPSDKAEATKPNKRTYQSPDLVLYGNINEITRVSGGITGKNDGGSGKDKTGF